MFVTFEGIDRSGKTTHAALLADWLGPETRLIREPGGTEAGERIRELIKDSDVELSPRAELMLFSAARAELMSTVIQPELDRGRDVVCDRFIDSTVAYQGVARGLGVDFVEQVNTLVVGSRLPDLTVLLKIDPDQAAQRHGDGSDRFESEGIELQRLVAGAYDELAARHADRIEVVDGSAEVGDVVDKIHELVEARR